MSEQFGKGVVMDGVEGRGQNFFLGLLAGFVAAGVGSVIWMQIAVATGWRGGLVALLVGALVGLAVRLGGNGSGFVYGVMGGLLTLGGCLGGEILTQIQLEVTPQRDFYASLMSTDMGQLVGTVVERMTPISCLIYAIGVYEGYKFSMR